MRQTGGAARVGTAGVEFCAAAADSGHVRADLEVGLSDDPAGLASAWDGLIDRSGGGPFLRPGWVCAWAEAFAPGALRLLTAHRGGELVGAFPLVARGRRMEAAANSHTPYVDLAATEPAVAAALARWLLEERRFARVELRAVRREGLGWPALAAAAASAPGPALGWAPMRSPYVALEGDWESYRAGLSRGLRKELGRFERRLAEAHGPVAFAMEETDAGLDEGLRLEASGWKAEAGSAILSDPRAEGFYRRVAEWSAARGSLRLAFLRTGAQAVAFDLCLVEDGVLYAVKGGFDPDFRRFGPGMLLTAKTIEHAYAHGLRSYELLGADDEYKLRWASAARERLRLQAFSRSPRGLAGFAASRFARPAVRRARGLAVAPAVELR